MLDPRAVLFKGDFAKECDYRVIRMDIFLVFWGVLALVWSCSLEEELEGRELNLFDIF